MGTNVIRDGPLLWSHEKYRTFLSLVLYTLVLFQLSNAQTTSKTTSITTNSNPSNSTSGDQPTQTSSSSPSSSSPSSSPSPSASLSVTPPGDAVTNATSPVNANTTAAGLVVTTFLRPQNTTTQMINGTDPLLTDNDLTTATPEPSFPTTVLGESATLSTPTVHVSPSSEGETNSSSSDQPGVPSSSSSSSSSSVAGTSAPAQETAAMETAESYVTYAMDVTSWNNSYWDVTQKTEEDDAAAFIRLIIIAGATAGSCVILLFVIFFVIFCVHRKQQQRKNARYYEFKKKNYKAKYEKVEQKSSLARRDKEPETPLGPGWVFDTSMHPGEYDGDFSQNVALRSITPIGGAAVPQVKLNFLDEQNGPPDSGHGGSIAPDDSALGVSASLDEEAEEFDMNPIYRSLGTSVGTGSDVRDHSCTGGDSDTISEGNEPIAPNPIRDVQFNSFGAKGRVASEDAVDL